MTNHIMLDIETWGKDVKSPIIAIGATRFNSKGETHDSFYIAVDPRGQDTYGRKIDPDTILWWMDPARRDALDNWLACEKFDLATALEGFAIWYGEDKQPVWGNGPGFDNEIVKDAYKSLGLPCPWMFWLDRDFRTLKNLAPETLEPKREGTAHDAHDDAQHQTAWLKAILNNLTIELT